MRFINFIAVLAAIATITGALQDIDGPEVPSTSFVTRRTYPAKKLQPTTQPVQQSHYNSKSSSHVNVCSRRKAGHRPTLRLRGDQNRVSFDATTGAWDVQEGGFLKATRVSAGQYSQVSDVSGCSAIFFFNNAGQASAAHITGGDERSQGRAAAKQAKDAGTTAYVVINTYSDTKFNKIIDAITTELDGNIRSHFAKYTLNTQNRRERWSFTHQSGDRSNTVTAQKYTC